MEFPKLGEHCALLSCKQLDFLPFNCDACSKIFCKDHVSYEKHQCGPGLLKDRKVPVCPLCNQPVSLSATENPDRKVNEHIENDCKSDLAKHRRSGKCNVKGCKKRELIPVKCDRCQRNFCLRHRHEADHDCKPDHLTRTHQSSADRQAGLAAVNRFQASYHLPSNPSNISRQQTQQARQSSNQMESFQARNMSEDQALALALKASMHTAQQGSSTQPQAQPPPVTSSEDEDAALARAIAESEHEERRRQQRQESTEKDKDSCILS
ncbi:AN1-type zinc finger protein 2B-like [Clytia hemisphaerica]|uniref:AN1-type domain-containing protein n=1 Tax=Clytia hemisphaerica TaxID=252671 RepID=A0A7M5X8P1_9CNID